MVTPSRFELELSGPKPLVLPLHHGVSFFRRPYNLAHKFKNSSAKRNFFFIFHVFYKKIIKDIPFEFAYFFMRGYIT